ncbi:MAG: deoxyribonuclease IV [Myxococcales bacterium]
MLLGAHESTAGGLAEAFARGEADAAEAVQIFTRSSRMWAAKALDAADVARFRAEAARSGLGSSASVHATYLVNLAADAGDLRTRSIEAFADELRRCDALGVRFLVVHPGTHADPPRGIANIARALDQIFEGHAGACQVLLETAAGQGASLGRSFEELRAMRDAVEARSRVAVCLDTCHVFAAGYDLATPAGYASTFRHFDQILGLSLLKAFHLNDSKKPLGCRVDRHEQPGDGCIGKGAFQRLVNDPRFSEVPGYLELPPEDNKRSLARLRRMRKARPRAKASRKGARAFARRVKAD